MLGGVQGSKGAGAVWGGGVRENSGNYHQRLAGGKKCGVPRRKALNEKLLEERSRSVVECSMRDHRQEPVEKIWTVLRTKALWKGDHEIIGRKQLSNKYPQKGGSFGKDNKGKMPWRGKVYGEGKRAYMTTGKPLRVPQGRPQAGNFF